MLTPITGALAAEELRIITGGPLSPFMYVEDAGAGASFDVDVANALCSARCSFVDLPFEETIPALIAGWAMRSW